MDRIDHLFVILAEECSEVTQRVTKALRFGWDEVQPGQPFTNRQRVQDELIDLLAMVNLLEGEPGGLDALTISDHQKFKAKKDKVKKYLEYSRECGRLS